MSDAKQKPIIDLFKFDSLGLIILFPSGVIYTNQVGGYACLHPEIEGIFLPLSIGHKKVLFALQQHFNGSWNHIEKSDAEIVDKLLHNDEFRFIKVDRTKLEESFEAWIYVEIEKLSETLPLLKGFGKAKGILTWQNSD
jgi:hypothetical protein